MAIYLGLNIIKINFKIFPIPHISISVDNEDGNIYKKTLFLISGSLMSLVIFTFCYYTNLTSIGWILLAYKIQLILELNPFFSDITIFFNDKKNSSTKDFYNSYKKNNYLYTFGWYIHLILWVIILIKIIK